MEYKVVSKINELKQTVHSVTLCHDKNYPRTIEWLKISDEDDLFLTIEEATLLKEYLDSKSNFETNEILPTDDDDFANNLSLSTLSEKIGKKEISFDDPIEIEQCIDLSDYNLEFKVRGYLNANKMI